MPDQFFFGKCLVEDEQKWPRSSSQIEHKRCLTEMLAIKGNRHESGMGYEYHELKDFSAKQELT